MRQKMEMKFLGPEKNTLDGMRTPIFRFFEKIVRAFAEKGPGF